MDPALRRLAWLCVLELCIENSSSNGGSTNATATSSRPGSTSTMEGGDHDDVDGERWSSMFKVTMEEEKENVRSQQFH